MLFILALTSPAQADQALQAPCATFIANNSIPLPNATDVPIDISPAFVVAGCTTEDEDVLITVTNVSTNASIFSEVLTIPGRPVGQPDAVFGMPQLSLDANTLYDLRIEGQLLTGGWTFTTGEGLATANIEPPAITRFSAETQDRRAGFTDVSGALANSPDRPIRIVSPNYPLLEVAAENNFFYFQVSLQDGPLCLVPEVRTDLGGWVTGEEICNDVAYIPRACSSTGGWGIFLGPLPFLFLRRRRS